VKKRCPQCDLMLHDGRQSWCRSCFGQRTKSTGQRRNHVPVADRQAAYLVRPECGGWAIYEWTPPFDWPGEFVVWFAREQDADRVAQGMATEKYQREQAARLARKATEKLKRRHPKKRKVTAWKRNPQKPRQSRRFSQSSN
jgi:hypothetical protein